MFGERLKDRCCTEGGGDGIWARKKGAHCGGQPTLPTEERNSELLGCGCGKACPIAQFVSPFEHCHTRFRSVSGSGAQRGVAEVWEPSVQGRGRNAGRPRENAEERGDGAGACVRWCSCMCAAAVTCSASDALSLAEPASRLASLAAARELLMPLSLLQMVALRASSSASTAVTRTCHPRGLANRGLGKPSVAFWCRSESRNPPKPGADGRSMFACTASVVGPPASQRTPSSPQTASPCSKSLPAESTEL